jgi:2-amino-4-hydroxy-6-hydroxymethyldihydropteridine diphosphokinase
MPGGSATVYLSLGSNVGDRKRNLDRAMDLISQRMRVLATSGVFETEPVGVDQAQPHFLNLVCEVQTLLAPEYLLTLVKGVERRLGRVSGHGQPRVMDVDILFYDDLIYESEDLTIPHPRAAGRAFVLVPLSEIAPELMHPALKKTIQQLKDELMEDQGVTPWQPKGDDVPRIGRTRF